MYHRGDGVGATTLSLMSCVDSVWAERHAIAAREFTHTYPTGPPALAGERAELAQSKASGIQRSAPRSRHVSFGSLVAQRDRYDASWGPKKIIFLIRDIDDLTVAGAPLESCQSVALRSPWGRLRGQGAGAGGSRPSPSPSLLRRGGAGGAGVDFVCGRAPVASSADQA